MDKWNSNTAHSQHLVLIAVGRHNIVTRATFVLAMRQDPIATMKKMLGKQISLQDTTKPFWAIARGTIDSQCKSSDIVEIVKAGGYVLSKKGFNPY